MLQKIIGRKEEQKTLQDCYESNKPEFVAVYGRRRIGKTFLVKQFFKEKFDFYFTGAYQATKKDQLFNFKMTLESYSGVKRKTPQTWLEAFFQLKDYLASLGDRRKVVFIDELPWFDTPRSNFISAIELFWNQWASDQNLMLVVCGSATSWMVNKLLGDKGGLHNRVTRSIYLAPFSLGETEEFLQNNHIVFNRHQTVECYMMLGGTPYYLNMLKPHLSLAQNINKLFFEENGELRREFDFLFRSLFKDSRNYRKVVEILSQKAKGLTRQDIIRECKIPDNGGLSEVLDDLCNCDFIRRYYPINKKQRAWCGYAFEQVCLHHIRQIKRALGIEGVQASICSWSAPASVDSEGKKREGAQIDLVIDRRDQTINLCEMKFSMKPFEITPSYLEHIIYRRELFRETTGTSKALHLTFVTTYGVARNAQYGMIQSEITMDDLFKQ